MLKKERIKISWAEADITPAGKVELYGQYYQRVSEGIHSRLGATVMALASESGEAPRGNLSPTDRVFAESSVATSKARAKEGEQAIMILADLTNFPLQFLNALRERIKRLVPAIVPEKIMMNATHTHSAPAVSPGRNWWKPDPGAVKTEDYRELVLSRLADAVQRAWENLCPAAVSLTRAYAVIGHCRRAGANYLSSAENSAGLW